ncbi:MAG: hypothetical protein HKO89_09050 [Saprospiraceae bacterium]|nr:hypothetical protein [Saprospiraceae bacterium]
MLADEGEALIEDVSLDNTLIRNLFEKWYCEKATMEDFFFETMIPVINKNETGD